MVDLTQIPTDQLLQMRQQSAQPAGTDLSQVSTEELLAMKQQLAPSPQSNQVAKQDLEQPLNDLLPFRTHPVTGEVTFPAQSKFTQAITDALTLPHDALTGKVQVIGPDGQISEEAIARSMNFAGTVAPTSVATRAGTTAREATRALTKAIKDAPTPVAAKQNVDQLYGQLRQAGITYDPQAFSSMVSSLERNLQRSGAREITTPKAFGILKELRSNVGNELNFDDLEAIRRSLGPLRSGPDKAERRVAGSIARVIDQFSESAAVATNGTLPRREVGELQRAARSAAARNIKGRLIEEAIESAKSSLAGGESGLRNEFKKLISTPQRRARFTDQEVVAIRAVVAGNVTDKVLSVLGKFGFDLSQLGSRASLLPTGAGAALFAFDPSGATTAAVGGAGSVAKVLSRKRTEGAAQRVGGLVRSGAGKADRLPVRQGRTVQGRAAAGVVPAGASTLGELLDVVRGN